jgi:periplasmic protein TonB
MREAALWTFCATIVAAAHVAARLLFATPRIAVESDAGSPVVTLELSPIVTAPAPPPDEARPDVEASPTQAAPPGAAAQPTPPAPPDPPEPNPPQDIAPPSSEPPPPVPDQAPISPDPPPVAPPPAPDVPPPPPQANPSPTEETPPAIKPPTTAPGAPPAPPPSAPSTASNHVADATAAPAKTPGSEETISPPALRRWQQELIAQIERHKRFPSGAPGRAGVVRVAFSIDETGRLISVRIVDSSGSAILDDAAIDLIRRAQPFSPPPQGLRASELSFVAPIRYLAGETR